MYGKSVTYNRLVAEGSTLCWHNCIDFEHLLEREGYFYTSISRDNPEIIFVSHQIFTSDIIYQNLEDFLPYISNAKKIIVDVNLLSSGGIPNVFKIPVGWPKKYHLVIHKHYEGLRGIIPQGWDEKFCDFAIDEYLYHFKQFPYRSSYYHTIGLEGYKIKTFELAEIHQRKRKKIFLSPSRLKSFDFSSRWKLKEIFSQCLYNGFYSCTEYSTQFGTDTTDAPNYLQGMLDDPLNRSYWCPLTDKIKYNYPPYREVGSLKELLNNKEHIELYCWSQSNIVHKQYYESSYISIYGETVEHGGIYDSEKTLIPMLQGHFILPFAESGIIDVLKIKGLEFPSFIDYNYDKESNYDKRLIAWEKEIHRLLSIPENQWHELYCQNIDIHHFNRKLLFQREYQPIGI